MRALLRRLRARLRYRRHAEDLARELDVHRAMAEDDLRHGGVPPSDARWKAARLLGNDTLAREDARQVWVARWIDQVRQDVRYAVRGFRRDWRFATTVVLTLGLGLGGLVSAFTVYNAVFLRPWPVRDARDVFTTDVTLAQPSGDAGMTSPMAGTPFTIWRSVHTAVASADLAMKRDLLASFSPSPDRRGLPGRVALVDDGFAGTIGLPFAIGGLPARQSPPAIAITNAVWTSAFGASRDIVGRQAYLDGRPVTVSGVLAPAFHGFAPREYSAVMPILDATAWLGSGLIAAPDFLTNPARCCVEVLGRLRPGATRADAAREIAGRLTQARASVGLPAVTVSLFDTTAANGESGARLAATFALALGGCGLVALLATANLANLQMARGLRRTGEFAIRVSLGAGRGRVMRQWLTESAVLAATGTAVAVAIAAAIPSLLSFTSGQALDTSFDARVALFIGAVACAAVAIFGLWPAVRVTRPKPASPWGLRGALLAVQLALSFGLVAAAMLLGRGLAHAGGGRETGLALEGLYSFRTVMRTGHEPSEAGRIAFRDALQREPGLALAGAEPLSRWQPRPILTSPASSISLPSQWAELNRAAIDRLGLALVRGRWPDPDPSAMEIVVSRSAASGLWPNLEPIGQTITSNHPFDGRTTRVVVGVMNDIRIAGPEAEPAALVALPRGGAPTVLGTRDVGPRVAALIATHAPELTLAPRLVLDALKNQLTLQYFGVAIAAGLAAVALALAGLGVFGVFAWTVEERRREIGVRLALGASRRQLIASMTASARGAVIAGLGAGVALASVSGGLLRHRLYGLSPADPAAYASAALIFVLAAAAATFIPLRRALRVDPAATLRSE